MPRLLYRNRVSAGLSETGIEHAVLRDLVPVYKEESMRKALSALGIAAVWTLMSVPAFAQDYPGEPSPLEVSDSTVSAGGTTTLSGSGCGADEAVSITLAGDEIGSTTADSTGAFSAAVTIPSSTPAGTYTLAASCGGSVVGTTTITVSGSGSGAESGSTLPFTGANVLPGLGIGLGLVVAGGVLLWSVRRRRSRVGQTV